MDDFRDDGNDLALIGRLKEGVTLAKAQREANELFPQLYFDTSTRVWKGLHGPTDRVEGVCQRKVATLPDCALVRVGLDNADCLCESVKSAAWPGLRHEAKNLQCVRPWAPNAADW